MNTISTGRTGGARDWFIKIGGSLALTLAALGAAETDVRRDAAVQAVERVMPAVVNIGTETIVERRGFYEDLLREFYGPFYRQRPADTQYSLGSGVIIDETGYLLTNLHVVKQANRIWVKLANGQVHEADLVGQTPQSDIALLKLRGKPGEKFPAARFGADDDLMLGETVLALGNPFGLGGSVSRGILSSKNRRPTAANEPLDVTDWLQTDAAINPGSSGGPLINLKGEVIGINVAVYREGQGIGFAIPIKRVSEGLADIFTPETIKGLWFGARVKPGPPPLKLTSVQPGSPAERAGLRKGDAILAVNDQVPKNIFDLNKELAETGDQRAAVLMVRRGDERLKITVRLVAEKTFFNADLIRQKIGASLQALTPELAEALRLVTTEGLVVAGLERNGPAAAAGLQKGLVLQAIDGQPTPDVESAAKALFGKKKGETAVLSVVVERSVGNFVQMNSGKVGVKVR